MSFRLLAILAAGAMMQLVHANDLPPAVAGLQESNAMNTPPSASRPPAPKVPPVEHQGVRYQQDEHDDRQGDQAGGYLVAIDTKTGERLWRLKVYDVPRQDAPGAPNFAIYFSSMALRSDGTSLEIENEAGGRFVVDLIERTVKQISGPPTSAPSPDEPPLPDLPPPPEN